MLGRCLVPSLTKKVIFLLGGSETKSIYSTLDTKFSIKFFNVA